MDLRRSVAATRAPPTPKVTQVESRYTDFIYSDSSPLTSGDYDDTATNEHTNVGANAGKRRLAQIEPCANAGSHPERRDNREAKRSFSQAVPWHSSCRGRHARARASPRGRSQTEEGAAHPVFRL